MNVLIKTPAAMLAQRSFRHAGQRATRAVSSFGCLNQYTRKYTASAVSHAHPSSLDPAQWLDDSASGGENIPIYKNFVGGSFLSSSSSTLIDVTDPATNTVIAKVPQSTNGEMESAVKIAKEAFTDWREVPVQHRQRIMLRYQALIRDHHDDIAELISHENGKTLPDARGDVFRGLEVVEASCSIGNQMMGETLGGVAGGMDQVSPKVAYCGVSIGNVRHCSRGRSCDCLVPSACSNPTLVSSMPRSYRHAVLIPAASWCLRRDSPLQLSGHDPAVDVPLGLHSGQHLRHEAKRKDARRLHDAGPAGARSRPS